MGRPKRRRLGQNFLVDPGVAEKMVGRLKTDPPRVLEIGPGRGALSEPLLERFDRVLALELDATLIPGLLERFGDRGFEVRHSDALTEDLGAVLAADSPWQVASNLPYSVGTAILRRLMPRNDLFSRLVVMLQREVAHRVVADPGGSGHGLLALERAAFADARLLFDVQPRSFRPRPKVISSVVALDLRPPSYTATELAGAFTLAARALTRPRKVLTNALSPGIDAAILEAADLDPSVRPGTVPLGGWVRLASVLSTSHKSVDGSV
ncbi:MAG: 16S rRNA (adenine(1518)-N(6)/adenine(1519)-N(6))-dimethyltransferase RsmA [Thermoanaerobaculales bacterium]